MNPARSIPILAVVSPNERAIVEAAAGRLADALERVTSERWVCSCSFAPDLPSMAAAASQSVVVTSLLVPLAQLQTPWADLERDLRSSYAMLCETGCPVMICTVLRHVEASGDHNKSHLVRRRLRQLNLLATELSREYGALIIDLDRTLSDIGARRLNTDYRLGGSKALEVASRFVARGIAGNALDAFAPVDVQDAACALIESERPVVGEALEFKPKDMIVLGHGRRKQRASTVIDKAQENHVGWLLRQALNGLISPAEALDRLVQAVRRRGARESALLLFSGIARSLRQRAWR